MNSLQAFRAHMQGLAERSALTISGARSWFDLNRTEQLDTIGLYFRCCPLDESLDHVISACPEIGLLLGKRWCGDLDDDDVLWNVGNALCSYFTDDFWARHFEHAIADMNQARRDCAEDA